MKNAMKVEFVNNTTPKVIECCNKYASNGNEIIHDDNNINLEDGWIIHVEANAYKGVRYFAGYSSIHTHGLKKYGLRNLEAAAKGKRQIKRITELMKIVGSQMIEHGELEAYREYCYSINGTDIKFMVVTDLCVDGLGWSLILKD